MRIGRCAGVAGASALLLVLPVGGALGDDGPGGEENPFVEDTHGAWLELPDVAYEEYEVQACGSTVTVSAGRVKSVEYKSDKLPDGTVRQEFRGGSTADVERASDGAEIEDLETGGPGYQLISADGLTTTYSWEGPSLIGAFDAVEAAAFAAEGFAPLFYFTSGNTTERVVFDEDPEAATIVSAEFLTDTALGVQDVCDLLDAAGDD